MEVYMPDIDISDVTVNDFKQGFSKAGHGYRCLYCSFSTERGIVYPVGEKLMDARRAMKAHVDQAHGEALPRFPAWIKR